MNSVKFKVYKELETNYIMMNIKYKIHEDIKYKIRKNIIRRMIRFYDFGVIIRRSTREIYRK